MKKFVEILADIKTTNAAIADAEARENKLVNSWKTLDDLRSRAAKRASLEDEIAANSRAISDLKMTREILKHNAKVALYAEVLPVIVSTLSKYNSKPYGEKTREKISNEVCEKTGARFYISSRYSSGTYEVYPSGTFGNDYNITIAPKYTDGKQTPTLIDNKVNAIEAEALELCYMSREYVEDIPARVADIRAAYAQAAELQEKLRDLCSNYNALAVGNLPQLYAEKRISERFPL